MKEKIAVAMSGGVDSSLTAGMLLEKGYDIIGITLRLWVEGVGEDELSSAVVDAKKMCDFYGIEHHVIDARELFKDTVIDYFMTEYQEGRTPNPCVFCNKNIKFSVMLDKALQLGCTKLVTGHYAQVFYNEETGLYELHKGVDPSKDQSYVMWTMNQEILKRVWFPLGHQNKTATREMAAEKDLPVAHKPDSEDICFVPDKNYQGFVKNHMEGEAEKGHIIHENGEILGVHEGLFNYTIGQRKGLGIAYEYPLYVTRLDAKNNAVIVGPNESLFSKEMKCSLYNFTNDIIPKEPFVCEGKIRYGATPAPCKVTILDDTMMHVAFDTAQRAITPGQSVVFYEGTKLLGGGIIEEVL